MSIDVRYKIIDCEYNYGIHVGETFCVDFAMLRI